MAKIEQIRFDLKESLLWQALNAQLLDLKDQGIAIKDSDHEYLQKFCFDNNLFATVTAPTIFEEVPFSLMTNFGQFCFVSIEHPKWNEAVKDLLGTLTLSIDKARADAFEALSVYDRKYQFFPETEKQDEDSDDDVELYEFIDECENLRTGSGYDFADILCKAYDFKASFITKNVPTKSLALGVERRHGAKTIVPADFNFKNKILPTYLDTFCKDAQSLMAKTVALIEESRAQGLYRHLATTLKNASTKQSIKDFCEHELNGLKQEEQIIKKFHSHLTRIMDGKKINTVSFCNVFPFSFLTRPFPAI